MVCQRSSELLCSSLVIISLFSVQAHAFADHYDPTTDQDQIVCVYQLSGQYGLLPRLLFYVLIVFVAVGSTHVWLIAGALASALIFSGTAAVHAFILAIGSRPLYDLDVVGVWAVLSLSCLAYASMNIELSHIIPIEQSRTIFWFWGFLVALGELMSFIAMERGYPTEPECRSPNGVLLQDLWGTKDPAFNCSYSCFNNKHILRSPTDIIILSKQRLFGVGFTLFSWGVTATGLCIVFQNVAFCIIFSLRRRKARASIQAKTELRTGKMHRRNLLLACLPVVITLNELYLLRDGGLPCNESLYSIGQWAPWVGVALALVAALIVRWMQPAVLERQKILDQEMAELELRRHPRPAGERNQEQHGVPPAQDANDVRPQQASKMATRILNGEDFGTRMLMTGAINTDLEAGLSEGRPFLLRKCPTL